MLQKVEYREVFPSRNRFIERQGDVRALRRARSQRKPYYVRAVGAEANTGRAYVTETGQIAVDGRAFSRTHPWGRSLLAIHAEELHRGKHASLWHAPAPRVYEY